MAKKQYLLLILICLTFSNVFAVSLKESVVIITSKEKEKMNEAIKSLVEENQIETYAFISAVLEKRLYADGETPLTKYPNDTCYYQLFPSSTQPYREKGEVKEVIVSRKNRMQFYKLSRYVNLTSLDVKVRTAAAVALRESDSSNDIYLLKSLLEREQENEVRKAAEETISLLLLKQDNASQEKALSNLSSSATLQSLEYIQAYIADKNTSASNRDVANDIVVSIERKEQIVRTSQTFFSGLSLGSILLLVALGLSIVYGLAGVINMSHGEFMMIGAYTTFSLQQLFPESWGDAFFWMSLPTSFLVAGLFGLVIERLVIRHLYGRPMESLLGTWGLSLILIQLCRSIFGDVTAVRAPSFLAGGVEVMDGLILPYNRLFIIGLTVVMVLFTYVIFFKSRLGLKIRSVTQNRTMSACVGIDTKRVDATSFFLGAGLAGIAGCAMTLIGNVVPDMGQTYIVDSFLIVVVGGVGKLVGTIISALSVGILSKWFEFFFQAVYGKVLMLALVIVFLQYRPKGLFPDKGRHSDD